MMTGTPCNFLSSQDGKVNTSKILFAAATYSLLRESWLKIRKGKEFVKSQKTQLQLKTPS